MGRNLVMKKGLSGCLKEWDLHLLNARGIIIILDCCLCCCCLFFFNNMVMMISPSSSHNISQLNKNRSRTIEINGKWGVLWDFMLFYFFFFFF